ncbi:sulfatase [Candidatus Hydrogenedentota bacterium]
MNVLHFICHDLGRQLNCYGDKSVTSPNIDALAAEGVLFENYFAASTPCSPSRGCIQTGKYAHSNGLIGLVNRGWDMQEEQRSIVDYLNAAGYSTSHFGFQHERKDTAKNRYGKEVSVGPTHIEAVVDKVVEHLKTEAAGSQPFYINAGTFEVHLPFDRDCYEEDDPETVFVPSYLPDNTDVRKELARFHGAIKYMDKHFGRIVDALKENGLIDDTIVIFTTDHGAAFPRAKSTLYDPGIGTALIMRFPESMNMKGRKKELLSNIDLVPTLLDLLGLSIPEDIQGRSFHGLLIGGTYAEREDIFAEKNYHDSFDPVRCIRTRNFKFMRNYEPAPRIPLPVDIERSIASNTMWADAYDPHPPEELYDLDNDPAELNNLAEDSAYSELRNNLNARLQQWMEDTDDPVLSGFAGIGVPPEQPT